MKLLKPRTWTNLQREASSAYAFIGLWIVGFLIFTLGPMIASLYFSFTEYNIVDPPVWIGIKNYVDLFHDPKFWISLKVTLYFASLSLPLGLIFSFLLAVLLNQGVPFERFWRTIYFLPSIITGVAVGILWIRLFNPQLGLINTTLSLVGIRGPGWLSSPDWSIPALVIISLWGIGQTMIIYLAGLQGIPTDLYDAATVDGANSAQRFIHITIPMVSPVIFYNLVLSLIATFQYFTIVFIVGSSRADMGGPARSTLFYNLYLYQNAFRFLDMGYASAMAWVLFVIILVLTLLVFRSSEYWVHYEGQLRK